jgi:hypothetical protein
MSTKKDKGKLVGSQSAREKMRFDSSATDHYNARDDAKRKVKLAHKLRPKKLNVALANGYGPDNLERK